MSTSFESPRRQMHLVSWQVRTLRLSHHSTVFIISFKLYHHSGVRICLTQTHTSRPQSSLPLSEDCGLSHGFFFCGFFSCLWRLEIKARLMDCCSDSCLCGRLTRVLWETQLLVTSLTKALVAWLQNSTKEPTSEGFTETTHRTFTRMWLLKWVSNIPFPVRILLSGGTGATGVTLLFSPVHPSLSTYADDTRVKKTIGEPVLHLSVYHPAVIWTVHMKSHGGFKGVWGRGSAIVDWAALLPLLPFWFPFHYSKVSIISI